MKIEFNNLENKIMLGIKSLGLILLVLLGPSVISSLILNCIKILGGIIGIFTGNNPINIDPLNVPITIKVICLLISCLIILGIYFLVYRKDIIRDFKKYFEKGKILDNFETSFKYWLIGFVVMVVSNLVLAVITNGGIAENEKSVRDLIDAAPLFMLFDVAIYAPIAEELTFRKSVRDAINNKYIYILISGIVFGGLHVITSVTSLIDLLYIIPYSALGISFAALYYKTNNIFSSITMHTMHNTLAIILYLIAL